MRKTMPKRFIARRQDSRQRCVEERPRDVAAWNVPLPKPRGRGRPPGPAKRGRKRKIEDIDDDDPGASPAAAALDSMGTTKPSDRGAGRGRPTASGDKDGKGGKLASPSSSHRRPR